MKSIMHLNKPLAVITVFAIMSICACGQQVVDPTTESHQNTTTSATELTDTTSTTSKDESESGEVQTLPNASDSDIQEIIIFLHNNTNLLNGEEFFLVNGYDYGTYAESESDLASNYNSSYYWLPWDELQQKTILIEDSGKFIEVPAGEYLKNNSTTYLKLDYSFLEWEDDTWVNKIIRGIEHIYAVNYPDSIRRWCRGNPLYEINNEVWPNINMDDIIMSCKQIWTSDGYYPKEPIHINNDTGWETSIEELAKTIVTHDVEFSMECPLSMVSSEYLDINCFIRNSVQAATDYAKDNWGDDSAANQYYGYGYFYGIDMEEDLLMVDYTFVDQNNIVYDDFSYDGPTVEDLPDWVSFVGNSVFLTNLDQQRYNRFAEQYFYLYDVFPVALIGHRDKSSGNSSQYAYLVYDRRDKFDEWKIVVIQEDPDVLVEYKEIHYVSPDLLPEPISNNTNWVFGIDTDISKIVNNKAELAFETARDSLGSNMQPVVLMGTKTDETTLYAYFCMSAGEGKDFYIVMIEETPEGVCTVVSEELLNLEAYTNSDDGLE